MSFISFKVSKQKKFILDTQIILKRDFLNTIVIRVFQQRIKVHGDWSIAKYTGTKQMRNKENIGLSTTVGH